MAGYPALLLGAALVAVLLAATRPQSPPPAFACSSQGAHLSCRLGDTRVEFLNERATWQRAHELCRRRRAFLVPSRSAFFTVLRQLYRAADDHGEFWLGAKSLRNGYFEWLLPADGKVMQEHQQSHRMVFTGLVRDFFTASLLILYCVKNS